MPDVALSSTFEATGSGKGSNNAEATLNSSYSSTLKRLNESIQQENAALRRELEKAVADYEKAVGKEYTTSIDSALSIDSTSGGKYSSNLELEAAVKVAATVAELEGRTHQVLLAREFLFRLCEARANGFFKSAEAYINMQENALRMIESISKPVQKSPVEAQAELAKQTAELTRVRQGLCTSVKDSCMAAAKTDQLKKDKCDEDAAKCFAALLPKDDAKSRAESPASTSASAIIPSAKFEGEDISKRQQQPPAEEQNKAPAEEQKQEAN